MRDAELARFIQRQSRVSISIDESADHVHRPLLERAEFVFAVARQIDEAFLLLGVCLDNLSNRSRLAHDVPILGPTVRSSYELPELAV